MKFEKLSYPEDWGLFSLQEVCSRITSGGTPSRKNEDFYKNGSVCWVKTKELENYYIYDTEEKITSDAIKNSSAKILPQNTILLAMYGATVGELGILSKDMACNQACCALIVNSDQFDYRYVFYLLKLHKKEIQSLATGAAQQNLSATVIRDFTFGFPILEKQKNIANILERLDKKIQLNTQTNQTLEAIAQTIFKSWFVDFDPVRAKAQAISDGKTNDEANLSAMAVISGKAIEDLSQTEYQELWEIADAFPSELVENAEFGEVPKGWEIKKIGEVVERLKNSQKLKKEHISDIGETPVFEQGASILMGYTDEHPSQKATLKEPIFIFGDHTCITQISTKPFSIYQNVIALKGLNLPTYWVYWAIKDKQKFQEYRRHYMEFIIKEIIVPNDEILCQHFSNTISFFHQKIDLLREENRHLAKIRDELLPKLLSGEIEL